MKTAFFHKVADSTSTIQTGRYLYEYDHRRKAVHVFDIKGVVDKYVKLTDCEDYAPTTPAPKKAAPKATRKATPAPVEETITLTKTTLEAIIAEAVAKAMAGTTPAPVVESTPKVKSVKAKATPKVKSAPKKDYHADKENLLDEVGKATLTKVQRFAKKHGLTVQVDRTWIWVTGEVGTFVKGEGIAKELQEKFKAHVSNKYQGARCFIKTA